MMGNPFSLSQKRGPGLNNEKASDQHPSPEFSFCVENCGDDQVRSSLHFRGNGFLRFKISVFDDPPLKVRSDPEAIDSERD